MFITAFESTLLTSLIQTLLILGIDGYIENITLTVSLFVKWLSFRHHDTAHYLVIDYNNYLVIDYNDYLVIITHLLFCIE